MSNLIVPPSANSQERVRDLAEKITKSSIGEDPREFILALAVSAAAMINTWWTGRTEKRRTAEAYMETFRRLLKVK